MCLHYLSILCVLVGVAHNNEFNSCYNYNMENHVECGILQNTGSGISSYIVGGTKVKYMQYPWMVALMILDKLKWKLRCGATLINSKFVLTAGHCFYGQYMRRIKDIKTFRVILGINTISIKERYRQDQCIKSVIIPKQYHFSSNINDIALMQLCKPIIFQSTKIRPICLPDENDANHLYKGLAIVAGWGSTEGYIDKPVDELREVSLPFGDYETCVKELIKENLHKYLHNTTICTYNPGSGKDSCDGDSGGPLMGIKKKNGRMYLRGIISFGYASCDGLGVCTKVSHYLDWIRKNSNNRKKKTRNQKGKYG